MGSPAGEAWQLARRLRPAADVGSRMGRRGGLQERACSPTRRPGPVNGTRPVNRGRRRRTLPRRTGREDPSRGRFPRPLAGLRPHHRTGRLYNLPRWAGSPRYPPRRAARLDPTSWPRWVRYLCGWCVDRAGRRWVTLWAVRGDVLCRAHCPAARPVVSVTGSVLLLVLWRQISAERAAQKWRIDVAGTRSAGHLLESTRRFFPFQGRLRGHIGRRRFNAWNGAAGARTSPKQRPPIQHWGRRRGYQSDSHRGGNRV